MSEANNITAQSAKRIASPLSTVYLSLGLSAWGRLSSGGCGLLCFAAFGVAAVLGLGLSKGLLLLVSSALVGGGGGDRSSRRRGASLGAH